MTNPTKHTLADLEAELALSEAQAARGETVPLDRVLGRIRASIARMEARSGQPAPAHARKT
jgi:hypothetical protein